MRFACIIKTKNMWQKGHGILEKSKPRERWVGHGRGRPWQSGSASTMRELRAVGWTSSPVIAKRAKIYVWEKLRSSHRQAPTISHMYLHIINGCIPSIISSGLFPLQRIYSFRAQIEWPRPSPPPPPPAPSCPNPGPHALKNSALSPSPHRLLYTTTHRIHLINWWCISFHSCASCQIFLSHSKTGFIVSAHRLINIDHPIDAGTSYSVVVQSRGESPTYFLEPGMGQFREFETPRQSAYSYEFVGAGFLVVHKLNCGKRDRAWVSNTLDTKSTSAVGLLRDKNRRHK